MPGATECARCGQPVEEQDSFCKRCGAQVEGPVAPAPGGETAAPGEPVDPADYLAAPDPGMSATAPVAKQGLRGRTVREFQYPGNIWDAVAAWAQQNGYELKGTDQYGQYYQKGTGFWSTPRRVQLQWTGSVYRLEAWVHMPTLNYVLAWGMLPREMILESGGFRGVVPRNMGRKEVNLLLAMLGQPPIP